MNLTQQAIEYKTKCLKIVQRFIDNESYTQKEILQDCLFITRAHFDDIIEERVCTNVCGYVLCENVLRNSYKPGQKYQINSKSNKVYEITRRRNFCSDLCFKCAEFLRCQISTEPIYMRKNSPSILHLYANESGLAGDEVKINDTLIEDNTIPEIKVNKPFSNENVIMKEKTKRNILLDEKRIENKISAPYIKEETFKELKDRFKNLNIHEKNITSQSSITHFDLEPSSSELPQGKISECDTHYNICDHNKVDILDIDIPKANILDDIDAMTISTASSNTNLSFASRSKIAKLKGDTFFMDLTSKMSQWMTNNTRTLLKVPLIEKFPQNDDFLSLQESPQNKHENYRWEYIRICAKLNKEEIEDEKYDQMVLRQNKSNKKNLKETKGVCGLGQPSDSDIIIKKAKSFENGKFNNKNDFSEAILNTKKSAEKKVRFHDQLEESNEETNQIDKGNDKDNSNNKDNETKHNIEDEEEKMFLPKNSALQPNVQRKQVFLQEIQTLLEEFLDSQFEMNEIASILGGIKRLVETFNLTQQNMVLGRKRNLLVSVLLLRMVLAYELVEQKYDSLFESNVFIVQIMTKFHLTKDLIDENLSKIINSDSNSSFNIASVHD